MPPKDKAKAYGKKKNKTIGKGAGGTGKRASKGAGPHSGGYPDWAMSSHFWGVSGSPPKGAPKGYAGPTQTAAKKKYGGRAAKIGKLKSAYSRRPSKVMGAKAKYYKR